ncbi:UDP-glucose:glycoprotein glucosyltransferase 1 isoform X2 [Nematostella vectensis]|uniref:UDP-glucose:glycoprotein glucosyltransferase 1 isoform X2 n=1 Tax=Nematostella vectensis TaxID=45351 RepID=UPI002076FEAC|nr:UDP-glucose:glycoprotein glucosyltransferase 1 isoform X2 [Nematostella vectensis]
MADGMESKRKSNFTTIHWLLVAVAAFCCTPRASGDSKPVITTLDSKWSWTPLVLEASEFLASDSREKIWKFIELSRDLHTKKTDLEKYNSILQHARKLLSSNGLSLLQFSLSMRYYSPKIELFNKVSKEVSGISECSSFVQIGKKVTCNTEEAERLITSAEKVSAPDSYPFDHHYTDSDSNDITVILHGLIGTSDFNAFHDMLVAKAIAGKVHYILRHYVQKPLQKKVRLSGYGVELAVKKTEYKAVDDTKVKEDTSHSKITSKKEDDDEVEGFLFGKLKKLHPHLTEQLNQFRSHLKDNSREMAPLKVWQLQDLSFQAAQRVVSSDPRSALKVLRDLSQNVPKLARSLVKTKVKPELRKEVLQNQKLLSKVGVDVGDSALFINGRMVDIDDLNAFELLDILREEWTVLDKLASLGAKGEPLTALSVMSLSEERDSYVLDTRDDSVVFVNDLENDRHYASWPSHIQEILRPTFPGMLRYIARNIFHVVMFVDPVSPASVALIKTADEFVRASMPARIGLVLVADAEPGTDARKKNAGVAIARAFHFVKNEKDSRQALDWLVQLYNQVSSLDDEVLTKAVYDKLVAWFGTDDANDILGPDSENDDGRKAWKRFHDRTGFQTTPQVVVNGVPLKSDDIDIVEEAVIRQMLTQTQPIQQAVFTGHINQFTNIYNYVMTKPNVVKRLNDVIQASDRPIIDLVGGTLGDDVTLDDNSKFGELGHAQMVTAVERGMKYFTRMGEDLSLKPLTSWIVADLASFDGRRLVKAAFEQMKSSANVRVGLLHNPSTKPGHPEPASHLYVARAVEAVLSSKDHVNPAILAFMERLLDERANVAKLNEDLDAMIGVMREFKALKLEAIEAKLKSKKSFLDRLTSHQKFVSSVLKLKPGQNAVIANGRVLGPLGKDEIFIKEDFQLLEDFDLDQYARKVRDQVDNMVFTGISADDDTSEFRDDVIMKISSVLLARKSAPRVQIPIENAEHSLVRVPSGNDVSLNIMAIVDPLSKAAQKVAPILMVLQNVTSVNINMYMNCREKLSEFPLNRFYRYVLEPQITFDEHGTMYSGPYASFMDLPQSPLLTMGMDTPLGWMVEAVRSPHDLDNIHLAEVSQGVTANFELEYIFIEGHCSDLVSGQPPRGLQFTLGTKAKPDTFDTIVMANLGYFQLKAFPGSWLLRVRHGRSDDIYDIALVSGGTQVGSSTNFTILIDSFIGKLMKVKVKRKPGMENADLLSDGSDDHYRGIWDSLSSMVGSDKEKKQQEDKTINIFSLASGHLYERFMRIMMLSVLKHTKSNVKFWFLKNYLSPTFKAFLPIMAKEYGFEYELVQYQWPRWLHAQTEKQRVIWGYKILFLDVLFPLNVKRILFVDADLIVRTDLQELMDMDLEGAPYAYTPFCSSRKEMDGFRFWNQEYWRVTVSKLSYSVFQILGSGILESNCF